METSHLLVTGLAWVTGGRRAPTSTWCPLGTLRETVQLSLSARRSSATRSFSCQQRVDASKTNFRTSRNTKYYSHSIRREVMPLFTYAHDRRQTWVLCFLARQQFTVSEVEKYTIENRNREEGTVKTTTPPLIASNISSRTHHIEQYSQLAG
jgi:hypothetical protein